jgi:hypothetical protein
MPASASRLLLQLVLCVQSDWYVVHTNCSADHFNCCLLLANADSVLEDRYEGHPQLQKLIQLKDKQVRGGRGSNSETAQTDIHL